MNRMFFFPVPEPNAFKQSPEYRPVTARSLCLHWVTLFLYKAKKKMAIYFFSKLEYTVNISQPHK